MALNLAHQYELLKLPETKWSWLIQHRRRSSDLARGNLHEKFGIEEVPSYEKGKYDLALLHLDQQCFEEGIWERGKGSLYNEVNSVIQDIPKIVIMHGTPYYPEHYKNDIENKTFARNGISSELIKKFHKVIKGNYVIFNSHTAYKQWEGDKLKARTIIHGLDPKEWWDLPKEPRVVTMISPGGLPKYYDRVFLQAVKDLLQDQDIYHCHITVDAQFKNWDEYRTFLGRSLLYFNPTRESPMPRARTEAMLSGCCVLTTPTQDAEDFIEDGKNGLIIPKRNPKYVVDLIVGLLNDYKTAVAIGQEGKKTALKIFGIERYQKEWRDWMEYVIEDYNKLKK